MRRLKAVWGLASIVLAFPAAAEELSIVFVERAPYYYTENGVVKGSIIDAAKAIGAKASLDMKFTGAPSKRVIADIESDAAPFCSLNWKRTAEREKIGNFTNPAFPGERMIAAVHKDNEAALRKHGTFKNAAQDPGLRLGTVDKWSFGPYIDGVMAEMKGNLEKATVMPAQNVAKVALGRLSYTLVEEGEVDYLFKTSGEDSSKLATVVFSDLEKLPPAYIWCSRSVPAATLGKINAALAELHPNLGK